MVNKRNKELDLMEKKMIANELLLNNQENKLAQKILKFKNSKNASSISKASSDFKFYEEEGKSEQSFDDCLESSGNDVSELSSGFSESVISPEESEQFGLSMIMAPVQETKRESSDFIMEFS